jgi:exonuclease SbcC
LKKFDELKLSNANSKLNFCNSSIKKSEADVKSYEKYSCISNPDCCLKQKQEQSIQEFQKHKLDKQKIAKLIALLEEEKLATEEDNKKIRADASKQSLQYRIDADSKNKEINRARSELSSVNMRIGKLQSDIEKNDKDKLVYNSLKQDYDALFWFCKAMSKDGISKLIIAKNLNLINDEINKILSKNVSFSVSLETDNDGKEVEIYFKHAQEKKRKIELCSGMEKTIAALAIRAAIVGVTTLPKCNVFSLDEVFSQLDPEYVDAVSRILEYLKNLFDSVIIITHIESMKDLVDHVVEVSRNSDGYSVISN